MNKITDRELKKYYSDISKSLLCPQKEKTDFLSELKANVDEYLATSPDADIDKIKVEFGTPEQIASSFMSNSDVKTIKKKLDIKKYILIALALALVIYLAFVVISLIDVHTESHGYMQEGIMLISTLIGGDIL